MSTAMRQKSAKAERMKLSEGEALGEVTRGEASGPQWGTEDIGTALLEQVLSRGNLQRAWKRVKANKGSAGIDGLDINQTADYLKVHWPEIRDQLRSGRYCPQPVRRVMIPKPGGGQRELGIPTVLDRLIQQAVLQVLQPIIDPSFSEYSYGYRPGRRNT